jgi:hypothetical protein
MNTRPRYDDAADEDPRGTAKHRNVLQGVGRTR